MHIVRVVLCVSLQWRRVAVHDGSGMANLLSADGGGGNGSDTSHRRHHLQHLGLPAAATHHTGPGTD